MPGIVIAGMSRSISFWIAATNLAVLGRRQREGAALAPGAAGAADAVDIVLGMDRHVEIEDVLQALDVEAARRDVAAHQKPDFVVA